MAIERNRLLIGTGAILMQLVTFWAYGVGRTMAETVGLTRQGTNAGLIVCGFFCVPFALVWITALRRRFRLRTLIAVAALAFAGGCAASELWILQDERNFAAEIETMNPQQPYSRARVWPHEIASLVYIPGEGIHATD